MTCSPFLLGGVINQHLDTWESQNPELIKEIGDGLYVDDLMTGGETVQLNAEKKVITTKSSQIETTKRGVLSHLAKIYDPLGLASPVTLIGKQLYRDICDSKIPWDTQLPGPLLKRWKEWNATLTANFTVPRALSPYHQPILSLTLHAFGDASATGVSAAVYAVVHQDQGLTQQLICAKSRLAKKNLTIPRLELIAGHMAVNLITNVQAALSFQLTQLTAGLTQLWPSTRSKVKGSIDSSFRTECTRSNNMNKSSGITSQLKTIQPTWGVEEEM
ncbi:hypothetical protein ACROYT_G013529 [Oculina patagonica]